MRSLLALVCPPLAVLACGERSRAVTNAGLTLCLFVPGVLHARAVVGRYEAGRRYRSLYRALDLAAAA